jgi:hypothetical protein
MKYGLSLRARAVAIALLAAPVSQIWAHPGHEHPVVPPGHPLHGFLEPQHLLQGLGLALIALVSYKAGRGLHAAFDRLSLIRQKARR